MPYHSKKQNEIRIMIMHFRLSYHIGLRELEEGEDASRMQVLVAASVVGALFYTLVCLPLLAKYDYI